VVGVGAALLLCTAALAKTTTVTTHQTKRGADLAASTGHALYMFTADKPGRSACSGACADVWLPLLSSGRPVAAHGSGVSGKLLGTIKRGRAIQVTYNGHPLYLFNRDKKPGQISGEGANQYGGHWYILNTSGNPVKPITSSGGGGNLCNPICQGY
jgi:predicted lipoprotein with Yx(FWY)xxD motif